MIVVDLPYFGKLGNEKRTKADLVANDEFLPRELQMTWL